MLPLERVHAAACSVFLLEASQNCKQLVQLVCCS